jgi:hypothetical protein
VSGEDEFDSTSPRGELVWTRVYLPYGRLAHLREIHSQCRVRYRDDEPSERWLGTGTQEEYEHAAELPLCLECFRAREAGTMADPRLGRAHGVDMRYSAPVPAGEVSVVETPDFRSGGPGSSPGTRSTGEA